MKYKITEWGRVYRSNGPTTGILAVQTGLNFQDVCEQIIHASRRDVWLDIHDETGKPISLSFFKMEK